MCNVLVAFCAPRLQLASSHQRSPMARDSRHSSPFWDIPAFLGAVPVNL
jgi:hypothetical protein